MKLDPTRPVRRILDRRAELERVLELVRSGRNLLVYGPRRTGKTSLLLAALDALESDHVTLYVDCTRAQDNAGVANRLLAALAESGAGRWPRFWAWVQRHLEGATTRIVVHGKGLRVSTEFGPPSQPDLPDAMELIGAVAERAKHPIVVVLDEFQSVIARDDGSTIAAMRSVAQLQPNVRYVFSGSAPTVLETLVNHRKAPFWKQLVELKIAGIHINDLGPDHARLFPRGIDPDAIDLLAHTCQRATLRLVETLDEMLPTRKRLRRSDIQAALRRVVGRHGPDYERELGLVKPGIQRRCLIGLARDQPQHPTGQAFVQRYQLGTPPNVASAMKRFRDLEILDTENHFVDPLFRVWLAEELDNAPEA